MWRSARFTCGEHFLAFALLGNHIAIRQSNNAASFGRYFPPDLTVDLLDVDPRGSVGMYVRDIRQEATDEHRTAAGPKRRLELSTQFDIVTRQCARLLQSDGG